MSGPVWRFDGQLRSPCSVCLRPGDGVFVEGEIAANALKPGRLVCKNCFGRWPALVIAGEMGTHTPAPAYARKP